MRMADAGMTGFQKWVLVLMAMAIILGVSAYLYQGHAERVAAQEEHDRFIFSCMGGGALSRWVTQRGSSDLCDLSPLLALCLC